MKNATEITHFKFHKIFGIFNLLLIIFGTFGNFLACFICLRKRLRKITTFKLLAFNTISDTIGLYEWNLQVIFVAYFEDYELISLWYCKMNDFLQNIAFEISAWLLVNKVI